MKEIQKLVENYWTAVYTGTPDVLKDTLAEDISGCAYNKDRSFEKKFSSREELLAIVTNISGRIREVFEIKRKYLFSRNDSDVTVQFSHTLGLNTNSMYKSQGCQKWTTKIVDGKMVLATLEVEETAVY